MALYVNDWMYRHRLRPGKRIAPMTTMISEVYEAFKEANVSDAIARKAAEAVAAYEARFASLDIKVERIVGRLTPIQWMLALLIGGVASLVVKAFA